MSKCKYVLGAGLIILCANGCASQPDVSVGYYLPKATVSVKVIQTAACTKGDNPTPSSLIEILVEPKYSADDSKHKTVNLKKLSGLLTDTELKFEFYDDGRLKSVNTSQTGQGSTTIEAALKAAAGLLSADDPTITNRARLKTLCENLVAISEKPLTITWAGSSDMTGGSGQIEMKRQELPGAVFDTIADIFGTVEGNFIAGATRTPPHSSEAKNPAVELPLLHPAPVTINLIVTSNALGKKTFARRVLAPQNGTLYNLPIQSPPLFGASGFEISLTEAGTVKSLGYVNKGGIAATANTVSNIASAFEGETPQERLTAIKTEADIIAAQQRLLVCQTDPANCK